MQISILQGSASGTAVYVETQNPTTNLNGLVTIEIGNGTIVTGTFAEIDWSTGFYFIKTETDPTGGTNYTITGTSQFLSVPFALFAKSTSSDANNIASLDALEQQIKDLKRIVYSQLPLPTDGLMVYYPFNGNANDESGNNYNGTVIDATLTTDRFNDENKAYHFTGLNKINTTFSGVLGNADRSISFWVKMSEQEKGGGIFHYGGGYGTSFDPAIFSSVHSSDIAHLDISNSTVSYKASKTNDNVWHHYVFSFSTKYGTSLNGVKIYQDGILLTEIYASYNYNLYNVNSSSATPFTFGATYNVAYSVDDLRFYNRTLTPDEIQVLYHEGGWQLN